MQVRDLSDLSDADRYSSGGLICPGCEWVGAELRGGLLSYIYRLTLGKGTPLELEQGARYFALLFSLLIDCYSFRMIPRNHDLL